MSHNHTTGCSVATFVVAAWLACCGPALADDQPGKVLTKQDAAGEFDGWKSFSESADTKTGDVWKLDGDVLICRGTPKGYLYTVKDYTNFVLTLEWRWPPNKKAGNGGVLVRTTGDHKIWPKSLEAQINAGQAGDFWGLGGYRLSGPAARSKSLEHPQFGALTNVQKLEDVEKPAGEWNRYEIAAQDGKVTLTINGVVVNTATNCDVVPGKICLTAEGDEIHLRNVRLIAK